MRNRDGRINKVIATDEVLKGWFAYIEPPFEHEGTI